MVSFVKRLLIALAIIAVLYALNLAMSKQGLFGFGVPLYQVDLWKMAGINVILAVSLISTWRAVASVSSAVCWA